MDRAALEALSLEEQVSLLAGASFWMTVPVERAGVPTVKVSDGPNGARGGGALVGGVSAACFPAGIALAASWDTALLGEVGQALAEEAHSKGARVLLAPTVNLHRGVLNGRNFECYSEDPYLTACLGVACIGGLQRRGVSATIKHFVGNESEFERMSISSEISERALRELYLLPFEAAVKAGVWAVMCAYNKLGGSYASEHKRFLTDILRGEWGFDGVVMSDWFATHSTAPSVNAGLDLEMPGPARYRGEKLLEAVENGSAHLDAVKRSAERLLKLFGRVGAFDSGIPISDERADDRPEHRALIRRAGAEGAVLLKNNEVLPLDKNALKKVAVVGPNARVAQIMGGGSAQVNAHYRVSPFDGLGAQLEGVELGYELGCTNHKLLPLLGKYLHGNLIVEYFNSPDLSGEVVFRTTNPTGEMMWMEGVGRGVGPEFSARFSGTLSVEQAGKYEFGLVSAGLSRLLVGGDVAVDNWDGWTQGDTYFGAGSEQKVGWVELEAGNHELRLEFASRVGGELGFSAVRAGMLRPLGDDALERAAALAADSDVAIVCVGLNGEWETEGNDRSDMELVGQQNELVARVAGANPNTVVLLQTGSPVTMPWLDEVAAAVQLSSGIPVRSAATPPPT